ncbi:DNA-3-methyladenine glycosylase [Humibacillus xanthopallidus]|uniref:Putative 3-methyladenine DNA glycosylase n=1 Tax=Humibacillus xanthopallidus TaxID=412689 RepID=A0A543HJD4_9MICO|nr:DNA-3-methyladenine glycosylase [Humibacillus xanthopallidus]TQM58379.1 DNA-3-methyladenine glycosylase [Humibacillus xanthopallidus]
MSRLPRSFFARPVLDVAADLLGRHVEHAGVTVRLSETEAYAGGVDPASRVLSRPTGHNAPVFGPAGHAFVYFTYGHHWMLCVVTGEEDVPEVVLLRAGEVVGGHELADARRPGVRERDWCRGPGRLTQALDVTGALSGLDLCAPASPLVLGAGEAVQTADVRTGARVGVSGPGGDGSAYPWRFWVDGDPTVSAFRAGVRRGR